MVLVVSSLGGIIQNQITDGTGSIITSFSQLKIVFQL